MKRRRDEPARTKSDLAGSSKKGFEPPASTVPEDKSTSRFGGQGMEEGDERPETFSTSSSRGGKVSDLNELPDVLTVEQVSVYLQVSRSVVYGEISAGRLPAVRLGVRVIRVSKWALQRWLERTDRRTSAESEALSQSAASLGRRH